MAKLHLYNFYKAMMFDFCVWAESREKAIEYAVKIYKDIAKILEEGNYYVHKRSVEPIEENVHMTVNMLDEGKE